MELLFKPSNDLESSLVTIIKTNKDKKQRIKAIKKLRDITNKDETTLVVNEIYEKIKGQPSYFKTFLKATIFLIIHDNIGYNYK